MAKASDGRLLMQPLIEKHRAPNSHEEEDAKKSPVPHENEGNQLEAEKPQSNQKEDSGSLKLLSQESAPLDHGKKIEVEKQTPTLASLTEQAREFTKTATGTSMAASANDFCYAAEKFAHGEGRKKKVMDTELNKSAMNLCSIAEAAPSSEAGVASIAIKLTSAAQMILLSDTDTKPVCWWRWQRGPGTPKRQRGPGTPKRPSLKQLLRAAIPDRNPMLPIYSDQEKQIVDKREVLYALALAAPVAILTAAAGLKVFDGGWATVAGISAGVWVLAASGMVLNQYSVFDWEWVTAGHVSRLGVLCASVLFCLFVYRAFFPSTTWALGVLLGITAIAFSLPWILSCIRGDEGVLSVPAKSDGDAAGRAGNGNLEMRTARRRTI